jgi:ketosteroid isomerase-like protein
VEERIEIPEGWARWDLQPIEPGGRRSADELMLAHGKLAGTLMTRRVVERPAGSRLRKRTLSAAVRGGFALMNRRDYRSLLASIYAEEVELDYEDLFLDFGGVQHGIEEVRHYLVSFEEAYSSVVYRPVEIVDPGGAVFAGRVDTVVTGRSSGIESRVHQGIIWALEGGRVRHQYVFREFGAALAKLRELAAATAP